MMANARVHLNPESHYHSILKRHNSDHHPTLPYTPCLVTRCYRIEFSSPSLPQLLKLRIMDARRARNKEVCGRVKVRGANLELLACRCPLTVGVVL